MCLSHLIYTVRPCLIHTCHAMPMPCSDHAVLLKASAQYGHRERAVLCCGIEKNGMVGAEHGHGMASVNQTRPLCVNQMGKTHSKPLAAGHGRGKAWARHGHGMLCVNRRLYCTNTLTAAFHKQALRFPLWHVYHHTCLQSGTRVVPKRLYKTKVFHLEAHSQFINEISSENLTRFKRVFFHVSWKIESTEMQWNKSNKMQQLLFYSPQWLYSTCFGWQSHPSSGWWVRLLPETCRVKPLRRIKTQLLHLVGLISLL